MDSKNAIEIKNVTKMYKLYSRNRDRVIDALGHSKEPRYREHYALHDISFEVKKGETVGIIGTNGAGKSTMLKIITGVLTPTSGEVDIDGRISALLELGAGFNPEYTGIENIYLNGTMMGFSDAEIEKRIPDILDFADIGEFVHQPVKTYSSGMFVRLAFAVAINIDPEILIVDEALSVGDVFFQSKCYKKFEEFKTLGKTILLVSHDLSSISKYCDRVILLNEGDKLAEGSPKAMINIYKKLLVNQFDPNDLNKLGDAEGSAEEIDASAAEADDSSAKYSGIDGQEETSWKTHLEINPDVNEYGDGKAQIIDFAVVDDQGLITSSITKMTRFKICSKVKFAEDMQDPIFTFTFRNVRGTDITGTNTMYEKVGPSSVSAGDVYLCEFEQTMNLQGGDYLLSISCTGYQDANFTVHHRLYDVVRITVISDKNTVGYYDMDSKVEVTKL